jgi:accessory gene regulator protein AgrB
MTKMQGGQVVESRKEMVITGGIIVGIIVTIAETVVGDVTIVERMIVTRVFEGGIITVGTIVIISQMIIIDERIKGGMVQTNYTEVIKLMPVTDRIQIEQTLLQV